MQFAPLGLQSLSAQLLSTFLFLCPALVSAFVHSVDCRMASRFLSTPPADNEARITSPESPITAFQFATHRKTGFAVTRSKQTIGSLPVRNKNGGLPTSVFTLSDHGLLAPPCSKTAAQITVRQVGTHIKSRFFATRGKQTIGTLPVRSSCRPDEGRHPAALLAAPKQFHREGGPGFVILVWGTAGTTPSVSPQRIQLHRERKPSS